MTAVPLDDAVVALLAHCRERVDRVDVRAANRGVEGEVRRAGEARVGRRELHHGLGGVGEDILDSFAEARREKFLKYVNPMRHQDSRACLQGGPRHRSGDRQVLRYP